MFRITTSRPFITLLLFVSLLFGTAACGSAEANPAPSCPVGTVLEHDEDGYECEPDENGNGVDDEDEGLSGILDKVKKKKKVKKKSSSLFKSSSKKATKRRK